MTDLTQLPGKIAESMKLTAVAEGEVAVGWKAITAPTSDHSNRVEPVRYMMVTNKGYYEYDLDGLCVRAGVLHPFNSAD